MKRICNNCTHCLDNFDCEWGRRDTKKTYAKTCKDFVTGEFGWVIYDEDNEAYCGSTYGYPYCSDIKDAYVHQLRKCARRIRMIGVYRILKVSLDAYGRPVAVMGRG